MNMTLGDSDITLEQVADAGETTSKLLKTSLAGTTSAEDAGNGKHLEK